MHEAQNPPYSNGLYYVKVKEQFWKASLANKLFLRELTEPIFALMARHGEIYVDKQMAKFALKPVTSEYQKFGDVLASKYPGYVLDKTWCLKNKDDVFIELDDLTSLLRSKDIQSYDAHKDRFFGS